MMRNTRKCDTRTAKKYWAESLIIVFRIIGQVGLGPQVMYESTITVRNATASVVGV